jgi:hypothetical protein
VAFSALLDACVLFPVGVRDTLLTVAEHQVYVPRWTEEILDEMARNVVKQRYASQAQMVQDREEMARAFPAALIEGYEGLVPSMTNHPGDRHVLAAAVRGNVGVIVTENVRDFPASACEPYDMDVQTADTFLSYALDSDQQGVVDALKEMARRRLKPPMTPQEMLISLARSLPVFSDEALTVLGDRGDLGDYWDS